MSKFKNFGNIVEQEENSEEFYVLFRLYKLFDKKNEKDFERKENQKK